MDININETVTLSIQHYEEMKEELKTLRQQVQEKTVIKEAINPIYGFIGVLVLFTLLVLLFHI